MSARVLMVDDEEALIWSTGQRFERERPDLIFEGFVSPREAAERIREAPPDLLVTDLRMPEMSGLDLLLEARRVDSRMPVVVISAYGSPEIHRQLRERSAVEFLEKPLRFEALVQTIDRLRARGRGFSGAISLPMLPDLIQIYTLSLADGALSITSGRGCGTIWFEHGEIVDGECGELRGERAFYELLGWREGEFSFEPHARTSRRTIESGWQELLMEGCRRLDERRYEQQVGCGGSSSPASHAKRRTSFDATARRCGLHRERLETLADEVLVAALDLESSKGEGLRSELTRAADWCAAIGCLGDIALRFTGSILPVRSAEMVGNDWSAIAWWTSGGSRAVVAGGVFESKSALARFRSRAARVTEEHAAETG